jgi:hypothetical protein
MDLKYLLSKTGKLVLNSGSCWLHSAGQTESSSSAPVQELIVASCVVNETGEECSHICRRRLDGGPFDTGQENGQ